MQTKNHAQRRGAQIGDTALIRQKHRSRFSLNVHLTPYDVINVK